MTRPPAFSDDLILSVHIPKAAGISLAFMLRQAYDNHLAADYPGLDPWENCIEPVRVIHGHFKLQRYLDAVPHPRVITFLREPLSRAISHFNYWCHPAKSDPLTHPVYVKYFRDRTPDLHHFLLAPEMANITTSFLQPLERPDQFYFIGFQETFNEDIRALQRLLGIRYRRPTRRNASKVSISQNIPQEIRSAFRELHDKDTAFFHQAKLHRQQTEGLSGKIRRFLSGNP